RAFAWLKHVAATITESVELLDVTQRHAGLGLHEVAQPDLQRAMMLWLERAERQGLALRVLHFRIAPNDQHVRGLGRDRDHAGVEADDDGIFGNARRRLDGANAHTFTGSAKSSPSKAMRAGPIRSIASTIAPPRSSSASASATMRRF